MSYFIDVDLEYGDNIHFLESTNLLPLTKNGIHMNFQKRVRIRFYEPTTTARLLYNPQFNATELILCVCNEELMQIIKQLESEIPRLNKPLKKTDYLNTFVHYNNSKENHEQLLLQTCLF